MIDLIVTWPDNMDYPLFRRFISNYSYLFEKIIIGIVPMNTNYNLYHFIKNEINASFVYQPSDMGGDWRDISVKACLKQSSSPYVWFLEQDFFMKQPEAILPMALNNEVTGFKQGNRLHPACLIVRRELLEDADFSANPPEYDHFGMVSKRLLNIYTPLEKLGFYENEDWYHHAGLSHNYSLIQRGEMPNYNISSFLLYNRKCMELDVVHNSEFMLVMKKAERMLTPISNFI